MVSISIGMICAVAVSASITTLSNPSFNISIDDESGAVLSIINPSDNASMSWISNSDNAAWQPLGSRWGLGFADVNTLKRTYWKIPQIAKGDGAHNATYTAGALNLVVTRSFTTSGAFTESYTFTNTGSTSLLLNAAATYSLAIYTPFNDHYTSTADVLEHRAHTHLWAGETIRHGSSRLVWAAVDRILASL